MRKAQFTKTLTVAISPELYEEIKRVTEEKEISISEWFRGVTKLFLDGNKPNLLKKENDKS